MGEARAGLRRAFADRAELQAGEFVQYALDIGAVRVLALDSQVPGLSEYEHVASRPYAAIWDDPLDDMLGTDPRYRELHLTGDRVAGDAEEQSLLFSGISNIVTTRSDVFTVVTSGELVMVPPRFATAA